ncbi:hypothetical protein K432DRAFT_380344 [Lepidopterella palustris CBS 459.81]|uniref:Uncharacterized protein n=1 Tax=Lepidopterella palustris CBS 459.81 TaxID=1314670 RepID=A0A8E2EFD5_9PEZI|nr:hypothetical protein K432DRAFT_380344 [Lepidopterella palustris CBS 459.81]
MLARSLPRQCACLRLRRPLRLVHTPASRSFLSQPRSRMATVAPLPPSSRSAFSTTPSTHRSDLNEKLLDQKMEEITDLYGTATDEFEIAAEETEKMTVYAADDRAAAREALEQLQHVYKTVVEGEDREVAEEVRRRVGQRIRELEQAVIAMEEMARGQD